MKETTVRPLKGVVLMLAAAMLVVPAGAGGAMAGQGVKLQFGYPLGSFVAHPSASHAGKNARTSAVQRSHHAQQKRLAAERARQAEARRQLAREREIARQREIAHRREIARQKAAQAETAQRLAAREERRAALQLAEAVPLPAPSPLRDGGRHGGRVAELAQAGSTGVGPAANLSTPLTTRLAASGGSERLCEQFVPGAGLTITVPCEP